MAPKKPQLKNQVIRRTLTDSDKNLVSRFYRNSQNRLKPLAVISIVIAVINIFAMYNSIDWEILLVFNLVGLLLGFASVVNGIKLIITRNKISNALKNGTIVEVNAPAYRNGLSPNATLWTVGPISIMPAQRFSLNMIQEGAQAKILCLPSMNIALSINDVELVYGVHIICPPNIETLASLGQISLKEVDEKEEINKLETTLDDSIEPDERLIKLKILKDKGLITEEDYENKKKEILIKI